MDKVALSTRLTKLFNIEHPVLLAAMDIVADADLTSAVSTAGGFGYLELAMETKRGYGVNWTPCID